VCPLLQEVTNGHLGVSGQITDELPQQGANLRDKRTSHAEYTRRQPKLEMPTPPRKTPAAFIQPMLLVRSDTLPEGPNWAYEPKLDGYRALAIKSYGIAHLRKTYYPL
jgi:ATP-dependent DNA ligase